MKQKKLIRSQKEEIDTQHQIIEEKNKDITNSINYAKRLQDAILPTSNEISEGVNDSFVLYKPKDIVAGDFYWSYRRGEDYYIAVADCTGHGVPGAMVSLVCSGALTRSVKEFGLLHTNEILDKTRELVVETFASKNADVKDGMDIGLCRVNRTEGLIEFTGANNGLYCVRSGELIEYKPDKQPIGKFDMAKPFNSDLIKFNPGDSFYLFTDGYADQFGGEKGKKLKYKNFKEIILKGANLPMQEQNENLNKHFDEWRGGFEQIDDVCLIGFSL